MRKSANRILAMFLRYAFLHRRSVVRTFDIVFWPVMNLLVWGFLSVYLRETMVSAAGGFMFFLVGAIIGWDIHYRGQLAVTISIMEEIWTRNLINVLISPLRLWEWIAATFLYGALKVSLVTAILGSLAYGLYAFNLADIGPAFVPLAASLLVFGWAIGLFTSGLLLRFGYAAEALIWGIPFLIQPFSCVFYPLETLPAWARSIAVILPSTYAFEGLRTALRAEPVTWSIWGPVIILNLCYLALGTVSLLWFYRRARDTGRLGRLGRD